MKPQPSDIHLPWELLIPALRGELSPDEDLQFREWLALPGNNRDTYDQLQRLWKENLADYQAFQTADVEKALAALHGRISNEASVQYPAPTRIPIIRGWMAAAVFLLVAAGAAWWWQNQRTNSILYVTTSKEQKSLSLPDGTTVEMQPLTQMRVADGYNKEARKVLLAAGQAHFAVAHRESLPFLVDMEIASVEDIGTDFTIRRTEDSINVTVYSGRVAFTRKKTGESRELSAGNTLTFYIRENRFGSIGVETMGVNTRTLRFANSPLSEVVEAMQTVFGKKVILSDPSLGQKRLTIRLDGESVEDVLKVICASLDLEYQEQHGEYRLKPKAAIPQN